MKIAMMSAIASLALVLSVAPASADYTNGSVNGTVNGWAINFGESVSDSFTLTQDATIGSVDFGVWAFPGDTLQSVQWLIGTTPFASDVGADSSAVSQTFLYNNGDDNGDYDIDADSFDLSALVTLNAGTYYLTLQNAEGTNGDPFYWDENDGPSLAYDNDTNTPIGSESFTVVATPEPALWWAFPLFMVGLAYTRRRRSHQGVQG